MIIYMQKILVQFHIHATKYSSDDKLAQIINYRIHIYTVSDVCA